MVRRGFVGSHMGSGRYHILATAMATDGLIFISCFRSSGCRMVLHRRLMMFVKASFLLTKLLYTNRMCTLLMLCSIHYWLYGLYLLPLP